MLWILSKRPDRRLIRSSIEKMLRTRNKRGLNAFDLARLHGDQQLQLTFARYLTGHSWADLSHIRPYLPPTSMHPWLAHPSYYYPPAAPLVDPVVIPPPGPLAAAAPLGLPAASYYRYWNTLRPSRSLDSICSSLDVRQDDNLPTDLSPALLTATKYPLDPLLAAPVLGDPTLAAFQPLSSSTEELRRILQTQHADGAAAKSAAAAADAMLIDATLAAGPSGARNYARSLLWPELMATGRMAPWAGADTPYHRMWAQEAMHWFHGARARKQSLDALYAPAAERLTDLLIKGEDWPAQRDRKPAFGK